MRHFASESCHWAAVCYSVVVFYDCFVIFKTTKCQDGQRHCRVHELRPFNDSVIYSGILSPLFFRHPGGAGMQMSSPADDAEGRLSSASTPPTISGATPPHSSSPSANVPSSPNSAGMMAPNSAGMMGPRAPLLRPPSASAASMDPYASQPGTPHPSSGQGGGGGMMRPPMGMNAMRGPAPPSSIGGPSGAGDPFVKPPPPPPRTLATDRFAKPAPPSPRMGPPTPRSPMGPPNIRGAGPGKPNISECIVDLFQ